MFLPLMRLKDYISTIDYLINDILPVMAIYTILANDPCFISLRLQSASLKCIDSPVTLFNYPN